MYPALETVQSFVAPVVMISANGLLCLAFYNRLSALAGRSRTMNRERFELVARMAQTRAAATRPDEYEHLRHRVEVLDELGHQLYDRARYIRRTLVCLLLSVLMMLACSLALGLSPLAAWLDWAALAFFVAGVLIMMFGMVSAILELRVSLDPLLFEHERMEQCEARPQH